MPFETTGVVPTGGQLPGPSAFVDARTKPPVSPVGHEMTMLVPARLMPKRGGTMLNEQQGDYGPTQPQLPKAYTCQEYVCPYCKPAESGTWKLGALTG